MRERMRYESSLDIRVSDKPSARSCGVYGCQTDCFREIDLGYFVFRLCVHHAKDLAEELQKAYRTK